MKEKFLTRIQLITMYFTSQLSVIVFTMVLIVLLAIYLINMFFKAEDSLLYFEQNSLEILGLSGFILFCLYFSMIIIYLHFLKFGIISLPRFLVENTPLLPRSLRLEYYNITGNTTKALNLVSSFKDLSKQPQTKLYVIEAFINAQKYKTALKLIDTGPESLEHDSMLIRKALIYSKTEKYKQEAKDIALNACESNKEMFVHSPDSKYLEIITKLAEVLYLTGEHIEAYNTLKPFINSFYKNTFYYTCRYCRYDLSYYFYILALIEKNANNNLVACYRFCDMAIKMFKESTPALKAQELQAGLSL